MWAQCNTRAMELRKANADDCQACTLHIFLQLFIYKATILNQLLPAVKKQVTAEQKWVRQFTGGIFRGDSRDQTDHVPFQCYLNVYYVASFHSDGF